MGQRASVIKFNRKGEAIITTLQWSTYLDHSIAAELRANPVGLATSTANSVINNIIKGSGHLSAIDAAADSRGRGAPSIIGKVLWGHGPQDKGNQNLGAMSYKEAAQWHLNGDSIGVISDLRVPGVLTFFWEDNEMGLRLHGISPAELRAAGEVPVTFAR